MEVLVLGIGNSLIPVKISCNEMHKYISTGYSETIIIKYPYLKGILDFNCIWLIHAFHLCYTYVRMHNCSHAHAYTRTYRCAHTQLYPHAHM